MSLALNSLSDWFCELAQKVLDAAGHWTETRQERHLSDKINWEGLAHESGFITYKKGGWTEQGGDEVAKVALRKILGDELFLSAVDHYVDSRPGFETARSVLRFLKSPVAIDYCHQIYLTSKDEEVRSSVVNLLKAIGDKSILAWVPQYLNDPSSAVQIWGIEIIQERIYDGEFAFEDVRALLRGLSNHPNEVVRKKASQMIMSEDEGLQ